jgi:hypothetical protein
VNPERISLVLTGLAAVVVVLTRVRLAPDRGAAGRLDVPHRLVNVHTLFGVPALLLWGSFLLVDSLRAVVGYAGLLCWWVTTVAGLLLLVRWVPAHGRHASGPAADSWGEGPGLSVLGHVGLLIGSLVWTWFLVSGKIG